MSTRVPEGKRRTLRIADFGAQPGGGNVVEALRRAVAACNGQKGVALVFDPGRYDVWDEVGLRSWEELLATNRWGDEPAPSGIAMDFRGCRDLLIDGRGAVLMMRGFTQPLRFDHCANLTVRGLVIDWDRPPFTTGTLVASREGEFDVRVFPEFAVSDGMPVHASQLYDGQTFHPLAVQPAGSVVSRLVEPGVLRVAARQKAPCPVGAAIVMRHGCCTHWGIEPIHCDGVRMEDITLHATPGIGVFVHGCRDVSVERMRVVPRPGTLRILSTSWDAIMFSVCSGTISVSDSEFAGMGDDGFSINSDRVYVDRRVDDHTLDGHFQDYQDYHWKPHAIAPEPGFEAQFFRRHRGAIGRAGISSVAFNGHDGTVRIRFRDRLPDDLGSDDIFISTERLVSVHIRNCRYLPNRSRGPLFGQNRGALIEGCHFATGGTGLFVWGGMNVHTEPMDPIVIRNNTFVGCGHAVANEGGHAIVVNDDVFDLPGPYRAPGRRHRGILIEGNIMEGTAGPAMLLASVDGLEVRGNTIVNAFPAVVLKDVAHAKVRGNAFVGGGEGSAVSLGAGCDQASVAIEDRS